MVPAPHHGSAAGANRWAPQPRAASRKCARGSVECPRSVDCGDSGQKIHATCERAPAEVLEENVVDLGTPEPPQK